MTRTSILAALVICLAGCATGYHKAASISLFYDGGYWQQAGPGELLKVGFAGNSYSKTGTIRTFLLYRCAELAQQHGAPYFRVYASLDAAAIDDPESELNVGSIEGDPADYVYMLDEPTRKPGDFDTQATLKRLAAFVKDGKRKP